MKKILLIITLILNLYSKETKPSPLESIACLDSAVVYHREINKKSCFIKVPIDHPEQIEVLGVCHIKGNLIEFDDGGLIDILNLMVDSAITYKQMCLNPIEENLVK